MTWLRTLVLAAALALGPAAQAAPAPADELVGLWTAKHRFGPEVRGPLILRKAGDGYVADVAGYVVPARTEKGELVLNLPNGLGTFRGKWEGGGVLGHWFQPVSAAFSMGTTYASPVRLAPDGAGRWSGVIRPFDDTMTFHLLITKEPDGKTSAIARNPERDYGGQRGVRAMVRDGPLVKLVGGRGATDADIAVGGYNAEDKVLTLSFNNRGGWSYDFVRDGDESAFYPRGRKPAPWAYAPPPSRGDGWQVGTIEEAGLDRAALERLVQAVVDEPMENRDARQVHAILIARHGKLVFESYFHGESRDRLHESRSASKSVTATLVGAVMQARAPLRLSDPVYKVMNGGAFPAGLEPRKQAITLEHLLGMTSGIFCDDNNPDAPAAEDTMWDQAEEPDFYRFFMRAPMASDPGTKAVYCSGSPNVALGMVGRIAGEDPRYVFDRLVARPLGIERYAWMQDPAGQPYGGGGLQLLPRDFMKFGQLMLNGGTWNGRRVLAADFVTRATTPHHKIGSLDYALGWWVIDYPYKGHTIRSYAALGNGGQVVAVIPELDLVVAAHSANYSDARLTRAFQSDLLPNFILPAMK